MMDVTVKSKWGKLASYLLLVILTVFSIATLFPFLWMISTSARTDVDLFNNPMNWIPSKLYLHNYQEVWTAIPFGRYFLNTLKLSAIITILQVVICSMAAYAFAKLKVPFKQTIFILFMTNLMMPWHSIMVPQFAIVSKLDLYNTHTGYVLIQLFSGFGIFLMRQFFLSLPNELNEAYQGGRPQRVEDLLEDHYAAVGAKLVHLRDLHFHFYVERLLGTAHLLERQYAEDTSAWP